MLRQSGGARAKAAQAALLPSLASATRLTGVALVFALLGLSAPTSASAAFCLFGHPRLKDEFRKATYVAIARGVRRLEHRRRIYWHAGILDHEDGAIQTVQITRAFKGKPPHRITLFDAYDSAAFPMEPGHSYLAFFMRRRRSGEIFIDVCGHSGELAPFHVPAQTVADVRALSSARRIRASDAWPMRKRLIRYRPSEDRQ